MKNIWKNNGWKAYYQSADKKSGIRLIFDKEVDPEVKRAIKDMIFWLRSTYEFPVRIQIFVKSKNRVRAKDGEYVYDLFFWPFNQDDNPYIKIATGDFPDLQNKLGKDSALATILKALLQELTHYFQWLNNLKYEPEKLQKYATKCARMILDEYSETREHP